MMLILQTLPYFHFFTHLLSHQLRINCLSFLSSFSLKLSDFLLKLEGIINDRRNNPSEQSYTSSLFANGINKIAQKVGEEAVELVIEAKDNDADLFKNEAADLMFHYLILLQAKGFKLSDITKILQIRNSK